MLRPVMNHRLMQLLPLLTSGLTSEMHGEFERGLRKGLESRGE